MISVVVFLGSTAAVPHSLRLFGARRSLHEAGWFGPSEFHKQVDITSPEHAAHRAALAELEKLGTKWRIHDVQHVPAQTINAIHALLREARAQKLTQRDNVASLAAD